MGVAFLKFVVELVLCATFMALLEIQIEGPHGWAAELPTWRIENRWTRLFNDGRPLTGYHLYLNLFLLAMAHMVYAVDATVPFARTELEIFAFLILLFVLEDWLWFVFNPAFGLQKFRREYVWWHARTWWWIMPRYYWLLTPLGLALYWVSWTV